MDLITLNSDLTPVGSKAKSQMYINQVTKYRRGTSDDYIDSTGEQSNYNLAAGVACLVRLAGIHAHFYSKRIG